MNPHLRKQLLTKYPEWHSQPLRLSVKEMRHPQKVINEFFGCYSLPDIRACLKHFFEDAIISAESSAADHFTTYEHLEKLVEAVYLIHYHPLKQKSKKKQT